MVKKYNLFYRTENLLNGFYYYGVHRTNNINDDYLGSGVRLKTAIEQFGIENFKKTILKQFDTYKEALEYETNIVNEILVKDPNCYNVALGGNSGENAMYGYGPPLFHKETGERVKAKSEEEYKILWNSSEYRGHSIGKSIYVDENGKKYFLFKDDPLIKIKKLVSWMKGKIQCRDKNGQFYIVQPDDPRYVCGELKKSGSFFGRKLSNEHKRKISEKSSIHQKGEKNSQYGTCWIYNNELQQTKRIKKDDLNIWLNKGWRKGMRKKYFKSNKT